MRRRRQRESRTRTPAPRCSVLMVEPQAVGHTLTQYGAQLECKAWNSCASEDGGLRILCPDRLRQRVMSRSPDHGHPGIFLTRYGPDKSKWGRWQTFLALLRATRRQRYDRVCLMYLDDLLFAVPVIRLLVPKAHLSGLFFRAVAHFESMGYPVTGKVRRRWMVAWAKNRLLLIWLKTGLLNACMFQDEGAASYFRERTSKAFWLPTPVSHTAGLNKTTSERFRYTLFGEMSGRKGVFRIRDAWMRLPSSLKERIELRLVGRPLPGEENAVEAAVRRLRSNGWHVFTDFRYVDDAEIPGIHENTDVLVLPYRNHLGTSGVLVQSLYWKIPVIVDDFGWPAFTLADLGTGLAVDTADPQAFANALVATLENDKTRLPDTAEYVVRYHSRAQYGDVLFSIVCEGKGPRSASPAPPD